MPLRVNITNESYMNIINQYWNITKVNQGWFPLINKIFNGYKYTMESNLIYDITSGDILGD